MKNFMVLFLFLVLGPLTVNADEADKKIVELENRVKDLESALAKKLNDCQMTYKFHAYRSNRCDEGTFPRAVTSISEGVTQLECGYYQLKCNIH